MLSKDIEKLHSVSRPSMAPDGSRVVVSVTHPSLGSDAVVGQLWSVPLDGAKARRITLGRLDTAPSFSPDGLRIAFLRGAAGSPPQLFVMDADGGEPQQLTDAKLGVSGIQWAPDSARIAYLSRVPEQGRYGTVDELGAAAEPPRRFTGLNYKSNGLGYTNDRRAQVFVIVVPGIDIEPVYAPAPNVDGTTATFSPYPEPLQLTEGDFDHSDLRFIGDRVAFISARHESRDTDLRNQLWLDGEALLPLNSLSYDSIDIAEDGTIYAVAQDVGSSGIDFVATNPALYRLEADHPVRLTDPESVDLGEVGSHLSISGDAVLVQDRTKGTRQLLSVTGESATTLTDGAVEIEGHAASGDTIVVVFASPSTFGDVAILKDGVLETLTDFSAALRETGILTPTELTVTGRDGYPVHGWVVTPEGEGPHPTLLMIHGGPYAAYSVHVFDEAQVYANAGYAVVYCNPRGSAGYGQSHGRSIKGAMGGVDMNDVLDFLDGALEAHDDLDSTRLGILGGSYGGYLTAWTIAHDHRFAAAIVERGYLDPAAFVGSSDIGWFFPREYNGTDHDGIRAQSPQAVAHLVDTPTLVIHSEDDLRCPISQAETWYATVKLNGVESEMLVFPGEDHELSRAGRPRHRVQRFDAIVEWFGRYL
ncbi:MAG: S9 family peptidase [Salinibacterium sp.]|nr:S9 family peptidase [Salinibacterium sp.]